MVQNYKQIYYSGINEISNQIRNKVLSPVEIVSKCLERIEQFNPTLNAFITVTGESALKEAHLAEIDIKQGAWKGPLHGIPVGIKDFYDTAGIRTTAAFQPFKDRIPLKDANAVAKLKEAGAIIVGKMNMHELGMGTTGITSYFGSVKNPWNSEFIPGGSSSGSGSAVASGMCYATLDTDAIGSCRLPASCCGVVGFKGTYGLINPQGILNGEQPPETAIQLLSVPGIMTRNVKDTAIMLDVLTSKKKGSKNKFLNKLKNQGKSGLKIGIPENIIIEKEIETLFEQAVEKIQNFSNTIKNIVVPFWKYSNGIKNIKSDRKTVKDRLFKNIDIILLPTLNTAVPLVKDAEKNPEILSSDLTSFINYYGLPALTIPCGFDKHGLPVGLQIISSPWSENKILDLANQYQTSTNCHHKHPF